QTHEIRCRLKPPDAAPELNSAEWSPDGRRIVTAARDGKAYVYDALHCNMTAVLPHKPSEFGVQYARFFPDGKRIATVGHEGELKIWDTEGTFISGSKPFPKGLYYLDFGAKRLRLATAGLDGAAHLHDDNGAVIGAPMAHQDDVWSVVFNHDGSR